jgi:hypothetical protein
MFFCGSAQISVLRGLCHVASASMRTDAEDQELVGKSSSLVCIFIAGLVIGSHLRTGL